MDRHQFIKRHVAGTAILAAAGLLHKASAQNLPSPDPQNPDVLDVDALAVGGVQRYLLYPFSRTEWGPKPNYCNRSLWSICQRCLWVIPVRDHV
jgi:hypothetical protein